MPRRIPRPRPMTIAAVSGCGRLATASHLAPPHHHATLAAGMGGIPGMHVMQQPMSPPAATEQLAPMPLDQKSTASVDPPQSIEDLEAAKKWADEEPFLIHGIYQSIDVKPFRKSLP